MGNRYIVQVKAADHTLKSGRLWIKNLTKYAHERLMLEKRVLTDTWEKCRIGVSNSRTPRGVITLKIRKELEDLRTERSSAEQKKKENFEDLMDKTLKL